MSKDLDDCGLTPEERREWEDTIAAYKASRGLPQSMPVRVTPTVRFTPLMEANEMHARMRVAHVALRHGGGEAADARLRALTDQAFTTYQRRQQSEGREGYLVESERELASKEWSRRLRELVGMSDAKRKRADERQVLCDPMDLDAADWIDWL